jgi:UMF1 family MFS transporter
MAGDGQPSLDRKLPIFSWAMYDFANTIYSAIVVTAFFPLFMEKITGRQLHVGITQTVSMVLAGLLVPVAGAIADRTGRAKAYLWWSTVACCVATVCIALPADDRPCKLGVAAPTLAVVATLLLFGLANLTYQGSLVFYDTLLPAVASPERQGRVSGLGVGLGYLGVVVVLPTAQFVVTRTGTMRAAFVVAGVAFLLSSLPLFLFVRVPRPATRVRASLRIVREQFRVLGATFRDLRHAPPVLCFFIGNFLCTDVVNTLIMWTRSYLMKGRGYTESGSLHVLMAMSVSAFVLGMGMGWLTDRLGPKRTLLAATGSLLVCIVAASAASSELVVVPTILVLGSGGLAGVWVAGRKFLLDVAPEGKVGEYFGLYGVTQKLSVLSGLLYSGLSDWTNNPQVALFSLLVPLVIGMAFLAASRPQRVVVSGQQACA